MNLLIVESPNKVKKIQGYLGEGWKVAASAGHIRDLPAKEIGVAAPDYLPDYVNIERSERTIIYLRSLAKSCQTIWLATDPDREGEAIAWHLAQILGKRDYKRVTFQEITKAAIQKAIKKPRQIDYKLFLAQQGRRVLDRLVGYKISQPLSQKIAQRSSAGRVQTPALRLIVDREAQIEQFKPENYYGAKLHFNGDAENWSATWLSTAYETGDPALMRDRAKAEAASQQPRVKVVACEEKKTAKRPAPAFTTSRLQQAASIKLRISVKQTMQLAQSLFEAGLITYHRTDSPNLSEEAVQAIWKLLQQQGMSDCIPEKPNVWKSKEGAQEAHEAIRPVDFSVKNANTGDAKQDALYQMIWTAAVCSQMKPAVFDVRTLKLISNKIPELEQQAAQYQASGRVLIFDGWMRMMPEDPTQEKEADGKAEEPLMNVPKLEPGTILQVQRGELLEQITKPPARYSEAALVKALEKEGIGRPSTYASIITILQSREYATIQKQKFIPTPLGKAIVNALKTSFQFAELEFTRQMEDALDLLAQGKQNYQVLMQQFDQALEQQLQTFNAQQIKALAAEDLADPNHEIATCPLCRKPMKRLSGKNGYFWICTGKEAKEAGCSVILNDSRGKPEKAFRCPECKTGLLRRRPSTKPSADGKKQYWWGCSRYKEGCKATFNDNRNKPEGLKG